MAPAYLRDVEGLPAAMAAAVHADDLACQRCSRGLLSGEQVLVLDAELARAKRDVRAARTRWEQQTGVQLR